MADTFTYEEASQPQSFTYEEAQQPEEKTTALGAAGRAAATGVLPSAAFATTAGAVFPWATGLASETGPLAPAIGGLASLVAGAGAAGLAALTQKKVAETVAPEATKRFEELQAADVAQHPVAGFAGELASGIPSMRVSPGTVIRGARLLPRVISGVASKAEREAVGEAAGRVVGGAAAGAVLPVITEGRLPTWKDVAEGTAYATTFGEVRWKAPGAAAGKRFMARRISQFQRPETQQTESETPDATNQGQVETGVQPEHAPIESGGLPTEATAGDSVQRAAAVGKEEAKANEPVSVAKPAWAEGKFKPADWWVTVQGDERLPDGTVIPSGYVQMDRVADGVNTHSTNPEAMQAQGFDVPSSVELKTLPPGQYTLERAKRTLSDLAKGGEKPNAEIQKEKGQEKGNVLTPTAAEPETPPPAPKESFEAMVERITKERDDRLEKALADAGKAKAIKLQATDGRTHTITPSTSEPGKWQLTWYTKDGEPWGHSVFESRDDALKSSIGISGKWGPPHGDASFSVVKKAGKIEAPSVTAPVAEKLAVEIGRTGKPKGLARGVSGLTRLNNETERTGPDILDFLANNMRIMSKRKAERSRGPEWWKLNQSLYDDAPGRLGAPHHNAIYSDKGSMPDQAAQAAFEAGILKEPSVNELWSAIDKSSKSRISAGKGEGKMAKAQASELAQYDNWTKATKQEKGKVEVTTEDLAPGDLLEVNGERVEVTQVDPENGDVTLKDGSKFGKQVLEEGKRIYVEKFDRGEGDASFPTAEEAKPALPKLGQMQKQGDLLSTQTEDFALVGERGTDAERLQAEKDKAARDAAEAKAVAEKQQQTLPIGEPPAPKYKEGDKVMVGQYPMNREGTISASGPLGKWFVKTNLGEVAYSEADIQPVESKPSDIANAIADKTAEIDAQKLKTEQAANDIRKDVGSAPNPEKWLAYYKEEFKLAKMYIERFGLQTIDTLDKFVAVAHRAGMKVNDIMRKAWEDATAGKPEETDTAKIPALTKEQMKSLTPERTTTQVLGEDMGIGSRPGASLAADSGAIRYQQETLHAAGLDHVVTPGPNGTVTFTPDPFGTLDAEGHRLIEQLRSDIPDDPNLFPYQMTPLRNSIAAAFHDGSLQATFGQPIARRLFALTQAPLSHAGVMLQSVQRFWAVLANVVKDPLVHLQYEWGRRFGGDTYERVFDRVMGDLVDRLGPEADHIFDPSHPNYKPEVEEYFRKVIAAQQQDEGGRVFRRIQSLMEPKKALKLSRLLANTRFQEAVQDWLQKALDQGIVPKLRPGKLKLTPKEALLHLVEGGNAQKIGQLVAEAVRQGERNAARPFVEKRMASGGIDPADEMRLYDDRTRNPKAQGPDPMEDEVNAGLRDPKWAHWGTLITEMQYSPVTLDLARNVIKGDFRGTKFKPTPAELADMRIDLKKLAISPDAEVKRVLDSWHDALSQSMDLHGATPETRERIEQTMRQELATQLERVRQQVRDPVFAEKLKRGPSLTGQEQMLKLVNANLFTDPRLNLPGMVDRVASKSVVNKLLPTMADTVKRILQTPVFKQEEYKTRFLSETVDKLGIDPAQADKAWAVFESAFRTKLNEAKVRAAEQAISSLTPKEKAVITSKSIVQKIQENIRAGNMDSADVLQEVARMNGYRTPTPDEVAYLKAQGEREERLRTLTADESTGLSDEEIRRKNGEMEAKTKNVRATIIRDIETKWASLAKPITIMSEAGRANLREAVQQYAALNLLTKIGHVVRFPIHLGTQLAFHFAFRPLGVAFESWKAGNSMGAWESIYRAYELQVMGAWAGIKPAWVEGRAEMLDRGEGRNVERLKSSNMVVERIAARARAYAKEGNYPMATLTWLINMPKYAGTVIGVVDQWQGNPAQFADILHWADLEMAKLGRTPLERSDLTKKLAGQMKYEIIDAIAETAATLHAKGEEVSPKQIEENAWNLVKFRLSETIRNAELPADDIEGHTQALRRQLAWQDEVRRGIGGVVSRGVQMAGRLSPVMGAFSNAIGHGINWSLWKLPPGLNYLLAEADWLGRFGGAKSEHSSMYRTPVDARQRLFESIAVTGASAIIGGLLLNRGARYNPYFASQQERAEMEKEGRKPGTVDFDSPDGTRRTWSLVVGPMTIVAPQIAVYGAAANLMRHREQAQAKLNEEAAKKGLPPGQIRPLSPLDAVGVGAHALWASVLGGRTAAGWSAQFFDPAQGGFNARRFVSTQISPLLVGVPGYQEVSRMLGVTLDKNLASVFDYLVPLPSSGARKLNVLGDPVGEQNGVRRVVQVLTGGSYPLSYTPTVKEDAAYGALANSGFHPPAVEVGKGYNIDGVFRPMNNAELQKYTENRGKNFKAALSALGSNADHDSVKAAFSEADQSALESVGAAKAKNAPKPSGVGLAGAAANVRRGTSPKVSTIGGGARRGRLSGLGRRGRVSGLGRRMARGRTHRISAFSRPSGVSRRHKALV